MDGNNVKTTLKIGIGILFVTSAAACGGLKVGADEETLAAAKCIADATACSDNSSDSGFEDNSDSTQSYGRDDLSDSTGGIAVLPDSQKSGDSYFMGTYKLNTMYSYPYDACTDNYGNDYDFPGIVRAYSHGHKIDFEDSYGNLNWIADLYPDDTFDFALQFQDVFGRPSNTVACTCIIDVPYSYAYDSDSIKCICDPAYEHDEVCSLTYDMI